jgi:hypothetical protein
MARSVLRAVACQALHAGSRRSPPTVPRVCRKTSCRPGRRLAERSGGSARLCDNFDFKARRWRRSADHEHNGHHHSAG